MRKLYNEYFHVPKHGKIREKVMLARVAMTVVIMVLCLAAMSITAYAYFSYNVTSGSNIIKAADFETNVSISIKDVAGNSVSTITPITSNYKTHKVEGLKVGQFYTVTITPTANSTAKTGFVVVSAEGCPNTYHTQQLGVDENAPGGKTSSISFKLKITSQTEVTFLAHWGTSSYYDAYNKVDSEGFYIAQDEEIIMIVNGVEPVSDTDTETENPTPNQDITTGNEPSSAPEEDGTTPLSNETTQPTKTTDNEPTEQTRPADENTETSEPSAAELTE